MSELWDAYDKNFNIIEGMTLARQDGPDGNGIPDGMYHLVCEVILRHTDGTYLITQRSMEKSDGGLWELTAGGSALKGETPLECAKRELFEETGIVGGDMTELERIVSPHHHSLYVEYLCITDCDKSSVTLQEGETMDYAWTTKEEILSRRDFNSDRTLGFLIAGRA